MTDPQQPCDEEALPSDEVLVDALFQELSYLYDVDRHGSEWHLRRRQVSGQHAVLLLPADQLRRYIAGLVDDAYDTLGVSPRWMSAIGLTQVYIMETAAMEMEDEALPAGEHPVLELVGDDFTVVRTSR